MSQNEIIAVHSGNSDVASLAVYDRITDPMAAIKILGTAIFKSGIFGLDKPEQGEVLAMQCLAERKSPLELARTYHFIQGQLAIRSDALLAKFNLAGGQVNWIVRSDEVVQAEFKKGESKALIEATLADYVANGTAVKADGKTLKDNWKRWPRRMLTARAISEGVRLICPEACFGTYTVEEMDHPIKTSYKTSQRAQTLDELIPEFRRDAAVFVLRKVGHLTDDQGWGDISEDLMETLLKRPGPFVEAVKSQYEQTV